MDRYSPVAPASVRVQVLPIGRIERARFLDLVRGLQHVASIIKLSEVESNEQELLSPKNYPDGCLLFNFTTSDPSEQQKQLAPYELFREPLLVIGVVDGLSSEADSHVAELRHAAAYLRERHPRVVHRQLLLVQETEESEELAANGIISVGKDGEVDSGLLKAAICKVASRFLVELATYTKAMRASPSIQTPGQAARSLQRNFPLRDNERRSGSESATPTQSTEVSSPVGDDTSSRPPSRGFGSPPPATPFDQIQGAVTIPSALGRSDSNRSRNGSGAINQDRTSVHSFGSGSSKEKVKDRGKARVGIVIAHIHMMAGQWSDALRMFVEHTNKARSLSDRLWHAKGLEGIVVCMLLLSWAGLEFQIPSICYPMAERASSAHVSRFSVNIPSDFRPADVAQQASVRRLSTSIPDLLKQILELYRSIEGALELPSMLVYEATVRFCKLMAVLFNTNSDLSKDTLASLVEDSKPLQLDRYATFRHTSLSKTGIDEILKQAQPSDDDGLNVADHISILAGMASVYALLSMERKKGQVLQDLVKTTTSALTQARRLGAAEMGIHPAATLSTETGTDAILANLGESRGVDKVMAEVAHVYGAELLLRDPLLEEARPDSTGSKMTPTYPGFGNAALKSEILKSLMSLCEASPDPTGVLCLATSILTSASPFTAVDKAQHATMSPATRDDQVRLAGTIGRTIALSRQMGHSDMQVVYWDPFLVRNLEILPPDSGRTLIPRSQIDQSAQLTQQQTPGNPLLYDPNASRSSVQAKIRHLLVRSEPARCIATLQNPFEVPVDIEAMQPVTDHDNIELKSGFEPITLGSMCIQQVPLSISPTHYGEFAITGFRVKIAGCQEQLFPIVSKPWSANPSLEVKSQGLEARKPDDTTRPGLEQSQFERAEVLASSVPSQPFLVIDWSASTISSLTLLDGQRTPIEISVRNVSTVAATVFQHVGTLGVVVFRNDAKQEVASGETITITFDVVGSSHAMAAQASFYYGPAGEHSAQAYARVLSMPLAVTVKPSLSIENLAVAPDGEGDAFLLSFDLVNACREMLSYSCEVLAGPKQQHLSTSSKNEDELLAPAETAHIYLRVDRWRADMSDASSDSMREQLFKRVSVQWKSRTGEARRGMLDLSRIDLTEQQLEVVRGPSVHLNLDLLDSKGAVIDAKAAAKAGSFVALRARLENQGSRPTKSLILRISTLNNERRLGLIGVPTRLVGGLSPNGVETTDFALCLLSRGKAEVGVTVSAVGESWHTERTLGIKVA